MLTLKFFASTTRLRSGLLTVGGLVLLTGLLWNACTAPTQQVTNQLQLLPKIDTGMLRPVLALEKEKKFHEAIASLQSILPQLKNQDSLTHWLWGQRLVGNYLRKIKTPEPDILTHYDSAQAQIWRQPENDIERSRFVLLNYGELNIAKRLSDYNRVRRIFARIDPIIQQHLYNRAPTTMDYYFTEKANLHVRDGEYQNAERLFRESIAYKNTLKPDANLFAVRFNDYGSHYLSQDSFQKALEIFELGFKEGTTDLYDSTLLYLNKAESFARFEKPEEAERENNSAKILIPGLVDDPDYFNRCTYFFYENQGLIRSKQKRWTEAIKYYQIAIDSALIHGAEPRIRAGFLAEQANCWLQSGQPLRALETYQQAWRQFRPNSTLTATQLPKKADLFADKFLIGILEGKASAFAALGDADKALQCYELIPTVEAKLREAHTYESSSLLALRKSRTRFDQGMALAWQRFEATKDTQYLRRAFALTEQARGQLLMRSLEKAQLDYQLPDTLRGQLSAIEVRIAYYSRQIAELQQAATIDKTELDAAEAQRDRAIQRRERFVRDTLYRRFPAYQAIEQELRWVSSEQVPTLLRADQTMLNYYMAPDALYIFKLSASAEPTWRRIALADGQLTGALDNMMSIVKSASKGSDVHRAEFIRSSRLLDSLLLAPEVAQLADNQALVVVPDGRLSYLPFEALLRRPVTPNTPWGRLPYLAQSMSVSYAYSASLLARQQELTRRHQQQTANELFGGYAPEYKSYKLSDLPTARAEVTDVQSILGGTSWVGADASEANFKVHAPNQRVLLMAMHGEFNESNPELSHLQFGDTIPNAKDDNDNILYANELSLLRLQADLAIMNACHTGNGTIQMGEGMYSLSRSLTIAGVPATIMSLWQLSDKTSRTMICDFFNKLCQQPDITKDAGLSQSKRAFLAQESDTDYGHPYFWAGLVVQGDTQPLHLQPQPSKGNTKWPLAALGLLGLLGAGGWLWRRQITRCLGGRAAVWVAAIGILGATLGAKLPTQPEREATSGTFQRCCHHEHPTWGFFAHQRINRMATLTLPREMLVFFKPNLEYLTSHAVDPDMRRYAVSWEAPRHYIDLDEYPDQATLPRTWSGALARFCTIKGVNQRGDTVIIYRADSTKTEAQINAWRGYFSRYVQRAFSSEDKQLEVDTLYAYADKNGIVVPPVEQVFFVETLSAHGILPWYLQTHHRRLVEAFKEGDADRILKLCAELGHYIGDAHVPLHTTSNYNGQKTGQNGIHGFWESRIPELFADVDYDYFVGKPEFFTDPTNYYWDMVLMSNRSVDSVLNIEQRLRKSFPTDQQMCPDIRQGIQVLTQCRDFAAQYQADMQGMVERRMRAAIHAVSSAWFTAWAEAGQPDLSSLKVGQPSEADRKEAEKLRQQSQQGSMMGRPE
jgi:CHAT domain-containing protein